MDIASRDDMSRDQDRSKVFFIPESTNKSDAVSRTKISSCEFMTTRRCDLKAK